MKSFDNFMHKNFRKAMNRILTLSAILISLGTIRSEEIKPPVSVAMIGLVHDHAYGFIPLTEGRLEARLVGIVEADQGLVTRYARRFNLSSNLFYDSLEALLAKTNVQAVAAFTSTFDHRRVVELCAARHIQVMVEKPLAMNMEDGRAIAAAAKSGGIQVIVNYETTWHPGVQAAYKLADEEHEIGDCER